MHAALLTNQNGGLSVENDDHAIHESGRQPEGLRHIWLDDFVAARGAQSMILMLTCAKSGIRVGHSCTWALCKLLCSIKSPAFDHVDAHHLPLVHL